MMPKQRVIELSVVVPLYNEAENLPELHRRLLAVLPRCARSFEILYVDDGSRDGTAQLIETLSRKDPRVRAVTFTRNFGQHPAVSAGFQRARGAIVATLDADLQNPPEEIPKLIAKVREGYPVVCGWRRQRHDPFLRRAGSWLVNRLIARLTGVRLRDYGCMLRAYHRDVVDELNRCPETFLFITAMVSWLGFPWVEVPVRHEPRHRGKSKYSLFRLITLNTNLLTSFSILPVQLVSLAGMGLSVAGFAAALYLFIWRYLYGSGPSGTVTLFAFLFLGMGILLLAIGILGEYVARIYMETLRRPHYVVRNGTGKQKP